ncbi:MAG: hypothetical protein LUG56_05270 [Lachnospiraceae bacterium]|nr:hypothetical protein [Lachnospiraceae bacterium]MCD7841863.1 hypothetical protein [Lachnospiraceae bacterium]
MKLKFKLFLMGLFCCMIMALNFTSVCAQSKDIITGSVVIAENIYDGEFDVQEQEKATSVTVSLTSAYVTRKVTYSKRITPPTEMSWTETLNGYTYSGVLKLRSYYYEGDETVATYVGSLEKQ